MSRTHPINGQRLSALDSAPVWLNSEPLTAQGLRGSVVLVDFWTYSCVNWLRTLPYVGRGMSAMATAGSSSSACTRPSSGSSTTSATCATRSASSASATRW